MNFVSHLPIVLGQFAAGQIVVWSMVLIVLLFVLFLAVTKLKQYLNPPEPTAGVGFTLSDLRQLHKQGKMTTEEFDKAKAKIIEAAQRSATPAPATKSPLGPKLDR